MANKTLILKNSNVVEDGVAKVPTSEQLTFGEIAINYAADHETLSTKNSDGEVVSILINGNMQTVAESLALHEARNDNPHGVTKSQVGLGNVDNTADADKPVSTAQQAAIDLKLDKTAIADDLTTSKSDVALSAQQGVVLLEKANSMSGGATADLSALKLRVDSLEEEVANITTQEDEIIAREDEIIAEFAA